MQNPTMAIIAFDRISPFHLSVPLTVFGEDRRDAGVPLSTVRICAVGRKRITTSAGFTIAGVRGLSAVADAGIVVIPGWPDPREAPPLALLTAVRRAHGRGALLVGLCLGTYVLAAAGVLQGRPATTHWMWTEDLAAQYPEIKVRRDVLYVDDGQVITSAGAAAGIDCCLHLMRRLFGAEAAARVARRLVVPPHRQGGQAQYIEPLLESPVPDRFTEVMEGVQQHPELAHSLDSLAAKACMSRRTFTRRFRQVVGTSVTTWLTALRLGVAQRLLETGSAPIALIAQQAGFGSEIALRKQFRQHFRTTPAQYRKEFHLPTLRTDGGMDELGLTSPQEPSLSGPSA